MRELTRPERATVFMAAICILFLFYLLIFHTRTEKLVVLEECNETFYCSQDVSLSMLYNSTQFPPNTTVICSFNGTGFEYGESSIPENATVMCSFNTTLNYTISPPYSGGLREISTQYISWSAQSKCTSDADCKEGGCNGELCGGVEERLVSICVWRAPPSDYGFSCGCVNGMCAWYS